MASNEILNAIQIAFTSAKTEIALSPAKYI